MESCKKFVIETIKIIVDIENSSANVEKLALNEPKRLLIKT